MFAPNQFPHYSQRDLLDAGPACLKIIAKYYGKQLSIDALREKTINTQEATSLLSISDAAEQMGFRTIAAKVPFETLIEEQAFPAIVRWDDDRVVVVYKIKKNKVYVADPADSLLVYTKEEFCAHWLGQHDEGLVLVVEPSPDFYNDTFMDEAPDKTSFSFLFRYLTPYKKLIAQLLLGLVAGSILGLFLPILTQTLVDTGINKQDLSIIYVILIAQIMLFLGRTSIEIIRSWILLHISSRVNIFIISDFLIKLMKLPINYFDSKNLGDILQRLEDHNRIKHFLTSSSLEFAFSTVNLLIFGGILLSYDTSIFLIFLLGSALYIIWILFFMKQRRELDFKRFKQSAANQSSEVQLVQAMQEIKLNNCEKQKRWDWETIQVRLFKISMSSLSLQQYQNSGGSFINELKNILITFWAAKEVVDGNMTLGMMMAAQQILGQLNGPILQFVNFIQQAQDAQISLERLGEVHNQANEDENVQTAMMIPEEKDLVVQQVDFRYDDPEAEFVLHQLSVTIPYGKTTAIVGASGSGKTTLLKLLLKFYETENGEIKLGDTPLRNLDSRIWRQKVGVVMQDGFIFSDSIANNIALGYEKVDLERLLFACDVANIRSFIEDQPLNYNTKIGSDGIGLSQGQKQRLMIARAVYKNPDYLFFDEATSALDANNEKEITEKIGQFTNGKTVIVIAHRLSTVKNADQIIVLDKGKVAELGNHKTLTAQRGLYYELVKNQLELGN